MKLLRKIIITAILAFSVISVFGQQVSSAGDKKLFQLFQKQTDEWRIAYNSGNSRNLSPLYTEDAQYVSGHVNGLVADGRDNILKYLQDGINGGGHVDSIEIIKMNVSCDLATLLCKYQATNSGITVTGRNLLVMKKINGKWQILQHVTVV